MARLTETASGVCGESAVVGFLLRAGLKVVKPYWGDDEYDFFVFQIVGTGQAKKAIPIPIQVKAMQSPETGNRKQIQGLKKKYVEKNKYLCLAIYSVDHDKIWLIPKAEKIVEAFDKWATSASSTLYAQKGEDDDLALSIDLSEAGNESFDNAWWINEQKNNFDLVIQTFRDVADAIQQDDNYLEISVFEVIGGAFGGGAIGGGNGEVGP